MAVNEYNKGVKSFATLTWTFRGDAALRHLPQRYVPKTMNTNVYKFILATILWLTSATTIAEDEIYTLKRLQTEGWSISEPLLVEEIERESLAEIRKENERIKVLPLLPFGYQNEQWIGFKKHMLKGERLYYISTPESYWKKLRGTAGYAILREGKVVYFFRTKVN
ncbi:MAG: hypothetical protein AB2747_18050 [Candidatus Thiodiazotropha taylori]